MASDPHPCDIPNPCGETPENAAEEASYLDKITGLIAEVRQRPSWDEYFMATAFLISSRSADNRLHVGCVMVSSGAHKNRIIAAGYNGYLPGSPHQSRIRDGHEQATVHAEQNAISDAARRGVSLDGATAYITHFPCINCAKIMAAAGISEIKFHFDYRNDEIVTEILAEANIAVTKL